MRHHIVLATGLTLFTAGGYSIAAPVSPAALSRADTGAPIVLVQAKKDESLQQKAKRAWRNLVGYKFDVSCPFEKRSCAERLNFCATASASAAIRTACGCA